MDRAKSSTFKGFRTFLVVGFTVFPILIIVTMINHNSIPLHVEETSKPDVLSGRGLNVSTDVLKEDEDVSFVVNSQNMGGIGLNVTGSEVGKAVVCILFFLFMMCLFSELCVFVHLFKFTISDFDVLSL